ncbi:hypothetical protein S40288_01250 [Stachybotrys chartarum IBT 40288]|nr:hypothetical protein S40288_01250 [Stachybotrys chartarum IBT 40288]
MDEKPPAHERSAGHFDSLQGNGHAPSKKSSQGTVISPAEPAQPQMHKIQPGYGQIPGPSHGIASTTPPPLDIPLDLLERASATNLRAAFRTTTATGPSIRAVTPDLLDSLNLGGASHDPPLDASLGSFPRGLGSQQSSPRSVPGGVSRRQGMVFNDNFSDSYDGETNSPPPHSLPSSSVPRPRTRTMDTSSLAHKASLPVSDQRTRVQSISSSGSPPITDDVRPVAAPLLESMGYPSILPSRGMEAASPLNRDKRGSSKRLIKRQSSRPTSPLFSATPSIDSLPFPVAADEPSKVILLMKTLCGRMRGEIEYQGESSGPWHSGVAYIDEERASLMFDSGQSGPFHIPLVSDLRGCRIMPVDYPEVGKQCLEVVSAQPVVEIILRPLVADEFDLWLAALLCWQQLRPNSVKLPNGKPSSPASPVRPELRRQGKSLEGSKGAIIKVGKIMLWDKGMAASPRAVVKRPSTRDPRSPATLWRRVSCILDDNGNFKLLLENDAAVLSTIELSQLSRSAIQQLDRTVLDEEYCIAIFPTYAPSSSQLSIFRPLYLALENRVHFEVWFVLLRAFAMPDVYTLDDPEKELMEDIADLDKDHHEEVFRVEKSILLRLTEAKVRLGAPPQESVTPEREKGGRTEHDPSIGNYLAEVILDNEVRARTTTKNATKNPFWREDCEFNDLPPSMPYLSVVLKKVEGNLDSLSHQLQASIGLSKTAGQHEITCGTVDISLDQLEKGKDHEQWFQVLDERQQSIGSMLVKICHEEHVVLLLKHYQHLSEILHRFPLGLTAGIAACMPAHLRRLSELFLNIFQASGSSGDWLMALVEDEIDGIGNQAPIKKYRFSSRLRSNESQESASDRELIVRDMSKSLAGEANLLFRGNSLLTLSLEYHMRRLGKEYLEEVLQRKIYEINEMNPDCEIDPSKLPTHATASELEYRSTQLIQIATEVWQCVADSANLIPPELRHVLKYIRAVAEDRYGDFLRSVSYTSVSGFLFLRFICPAILSPKLWGLLRDHPRPRAQRTFTLIAKALQKMANLSTFGKREEYMEPMNRFLGAQRQVFKDYIDQVCGIPAERSANSIPASYSTPLTILNRLDPAAKEGFPSLPYLIDEARSYASLVKLWTDARPLETKNLEAEGELLEFNDLCFALQQRADACLAKAESYRAAEASNYPDDLADTLDQATLIESLSVPYSNSATTAATSITWMDRPPGSAGSDNTGEEQNPRGRSVEPRRGRDGWESRKSSGFRHVSGSSSSGTLRAKNGKVGRTILNGIMRISGNTRGDSPESRGPDSRRQ